MDEMQLDEPDIAFPTFSTAKTAMIRGRSQQPGTSNARKAQRPAAKNKTARQPFRNHNERNPCYRGNAQRICKTTRRVDKVTPKPRCEKIAVVHRGGRTIIRIFTVKDGPVHDAEEDTKLRAELEKLSLAEVVGSRRGRRDERLTKGPEMMSVDTD